MIDPTTLLIAPMRNEGPFILEWVAWHRSIGFDQLLVVTNDCTDGSEALLDVLEARGLLRHLRHRPPEGSFALKSAYRAARAAPEVNHTNWVMALDADEFLIVHEGAGRVQDLLMAHAHRPLGIAVHWKCFGHGGQDIWEPGLVRHQFTQCGDTQNPANMRFKSIFRDPGQFEEFSSHTPNNYGGTWGGDNVWVTSDGARIQKVNLTGANRAHATAMRRITHKAAQINHYALKAKDCLLERRLKWESSNRAFRYDADFVERYDVNTHRDITALNREAAFEAIYLPLIQNPEIAALHAICCKAYRATIDAAKTPRP